MKKIIALASFAALMTSAPSFAQTAYSLFWKADGKQIEEIVSEEAVQYQAVGHHGPAVENCASAFRIYFNNSGAIDVYSKNGRNMELERYLWYPTPEQQEKYGAGCDEYLVGKTVGLGGIALWDGEKEIKLEATKGRTARVGKTKKGAFAEMIAYGVPYKGGMVDISIRIDVFNKSRVATVTATELNKKKVQFLTGVNYHEGEQTKIGDGYMYAWGIHPADVSTDPVALGAGMFYNSKTFPNETKTENMLRLISKPASKIQTKIVAASIKEAELNTAERFAAFMSK